MVLRTAALYGHDPRELETSAAVLALRGVHPTVDAAREALLKVRDRPLPEKPAARRPLRTWVRSVYVLLIFGGFLSAPSDTRDQSAHPWLKASFGFLVGATIWAITWVLPLTFMIAMAWGCETHTRELGRRALAFYDGEADTAEAAIAAARTARTAATASGRACAPRSSSCRSPFRSASSPTSTTSARAPASAGSPQSGHSSRSPWSSPPLLLPAGDNRRRRSRTCLKRPAGAWNARSRSRLRARSWCRPC